MLAVGSLLARSDGFDRFGDGPGVVGAIFGLVFLIVPLALVIYTVLLLRRIGSETGRIADAMEVLAQRPSAGGGTSSGGTP
jgi:hypothetical protein